MALRRTAANTAGHALHPDGISAQRKVDMKLSLNTHLSALAMAAWGAIASEAAFAQPDPSLADVALPRLQQMVESCDLLAPQRHAQTLTQAFCAAAADELRQRAFAGDHDRLLAWWRERRAAGQPSSGSGSTPQSSPLSGATPAQLQLTYLQCEEQAQAALLDSATAASCSIVYEELKQRVFGGDFNRLHAWWRQQQVRAASTASRPTNEARP
jgi:hypothetical protein